MNHVRLNIMKKGDRVLSFNGEYISIERANREVDVIHIILDENGYIRIDNENRLTIGYGDESVEVRGDNGIKVETF